jgi:serine/threonine protein kinase
MVERVVMVTGHAKKALLQASSKGRRNALAVDNPGQCGTEKVQEMQIGQVISGKYRLLRLLGDGGMGSVYEAQHEVLGTRVAIKVLHQDLMQKPGLVDRFLREARVSAQIQNPHVVRVLDVDRTADGAAYIVMELLAGEELSAVLQRERKLPLPIAVDYASQILDALSAAHALGVVHRDLKPENVFVTQQEGRPLLRLIDFGIAKAHQLNNAPNLTVSGTLMGTPEYMAPEQAHSADKADARSDLYAVGVMLYEMLSGTRPVDGADPRVVAVKVERGEVKALIHVMPDVPRDLAGLVHRAMAPRAELRFASAGEMRAALDAVGKGKQTTPTPLSPPHAGASVSPSQAVASVVPVQSRVPPVVSPQEQRQEASGTLVGGPPGSGELAALTTHAGGPAYPPAQVPPAQGWAQPGAPAAAYGAPHYASSPPRGRGRRGGGMIWLVLAVPVLDGGGVAVAFAVNNASGGPPNPATPSTPSTPATSNAATASTAASPQPGPMPGPLLPAPTRDTPPPPLLPPSSPPPNHPTDHPRPNPSTSSAPSASTPPMSPVAPFGMPPFALPSGFPPIVNPFPTPAGSGTGPIFTLPTAFPGFPGAAPPAPSAPPGH